MGERLICSGRARAGSRRCKRFCGLDRRGLADVCGEPRSALGARFWRDLGWRARQAAGIERDSEAPP
jgi:hypothetical protein